MMITRRRAIAVLAAAAGLPFLLNATRAQAQLVRWEGTAMGAPASLALHAEDEAAARIAIDAAVAELSRLEAIFSLYRADSAVSRLNREGALVAAPLELVELLGRAQAYAELTGGAFDPTIQPLWQLYLSHFTAVAPDPNGPAADDLRRAAALVDWRGVVIADGAVRFARPGMGLSLNGIAQGYITDRITALLRNHGFGRMLVDMGEPRAVSSRPDGNAWRVGIAHPAAPERVATTVEVVDKAVATSGGYGTVFDAFGNFTHLIEPRSGATAPARYGVTVIAESATAADALSTALAVAPAERRRAIVAAAGVQALFVAEDGSAERIG